MHFEGFASPTEGFQWYTSILILSVFHFDTKIMHAFGWSFFAGFDSFLLSLAEKWFMGYFIQSHFEFKCVTVWVQMCDCLSSKVDLNKCAATGIVEHPIQFWIQMCDCLSESLASNNNNKIKIIITKIIFCN